MLKLKEARALIEKSVTPIPGREMVPLARAVGRILAEEIRAPFDLPREDNSAMDGYAVALSGDQTRFEVVGESFAGHPFRGRLLPGQAVRIFTGAVLPEGADAVVPQEEVERQGAWLLLREPPQPGSWIRRRGSDLKGGATVFRTGRWLKAADIGLLAALGLPWVPVRPLLRVAFFSTGEELRPPGEPLREGELYDSNRFSLRALLAPLPVEGSDLGQIGDTWRETVQLLEGAGREFDLLISTGGASVGEADLLHRALQQVGEVKLWKVAVKPGKPLLFGKLERAWFFGLPGNPVSVHVSFLTFVRPAIFRLLGAEIPSPLRLRVATLKPIRKTAERFELQRGRLVRQEDGGLAVLPLPGQGSHQLFALAESDCFILLPEGRYTVAQGERVWVELFELGR